MKRFLYLLEELVVYIFGFFVTNMIRAVFYLNSVKTYDDLDLWISCFRGNCTIKNTPDFFIYVIGLVLISLLFIFVWKFIKKIHLKIGKSKLYIALETILFVIYYILNTIQLYELIYKPFKLGIFMNILLSITMIFPLIYIMYDKSLERQGK